MAESAYDVLKGEFPKLFEDVLDNHEEISKFLMLLYSHTLYASAGRPEKPANLNFKINIYRETLLHIQLFHDRDREDGSTAGTRDPTKRNMALAAFLKESPAMRRMAVDVVYVLQRFVDEKPWRKIQGLSNLRFENPRMWGGNYTFTAELIMKIQFDELIKARMKWPEDPDLREDSNVVIVEG